MNSAPSAMIRFYSVAVGYFIQGSPSSFVTY
jgi:hypothetical protein